MSFLAVAITGTVVALSGGYSAYEASKQTGIAKESMRRGEDEARKREAAANKLQSEEEARRNQTAMRSMRRRGMTESRAGQPRDTILTSPMGVIGSPTYANKTLLGS